MKARCIAAAVLLLALLAGSAFAATAPVPPSLTKQFGSVQVDYARDVATDAAGNVYVAGTTHGAIDAPAQIVPNANKGGADAFVAKFDPDGTLLWVTQFGSAADDFVEGISLDKFGFLYAAGWTRGSMPGGADQSGTPNTNAGGTDIFVAKIHCESGTTRWIKQYGSPKDDVANGVATDRSGFVFVVGSTSGAIDGTTDPGDYSDAFIMKLDSYGINMAVNQFNAAARPLDNYAYAVAVDSHASYDYIFVTGLVRAYENGSLFVARFDTWLDPDTRKIVTLGGPNKGSDNDIGRAIAIDSKGFVIVAGSTSGAFEGNAWSGAEDIVVVKYTNSLNLFWSYQYGSTTNDVAYGVTVDAEDGIYITGITGYPGGPGLDGQTYLGGSDIFLARFSPDGRKLFTRQVGTAAQDWAYGIAIVPSGAIYLAAATEGAMGVPNAGIIDAVLIKYDKDPAPRPATEFFINGTIKELPLGLGTRECQHHRQGHSRECCWRLPHEFVGPVRFKGDDTRQVFHSQAQNRVRGPGRSRRSGAHRGGPGRCTGQLHGKDRRQDTDDFQEGIQHHPVHEAPAGDRSVSALFGQYAGNPYVGLIFSFDMPMQYLLLSKKKPSGT